MLGKGQRVVRAILGLYHPLDGQMIFLRKRIVAVVVRGNCHHAARSIACKHIIRRPDRHLAPVDRVHRIRARKHARLFACGRQAVDLACARRVFLIFLHRSPLLRRSDLLHQRMLGRDDHIGAAAERICARCKHGKVAAALRCRISPRRPAIFRSSSSASAWSFPASRCWSRPCQKLLRVIRDLKKPLRQMLPRDLRVRSARRQPSTTCSFASTVLHEGHQLTGAALR